MNMIDILTINGQEVADVSGEAGFLADAEAVKALADTITSQTKAAGIVVNKEAIHPLLDHDTGLTRSTLAKLAPPLRIAVYGDFSEELGDAIKGFTYESDEYIDVIYAAEKADAISQILAK